MKWILYPLTLKAIQKLTTVFLVLFSLLFFTTAKAQTGPFNIYDAFGDPPSLGSYSFGHDPTPGGIVIGHRFQVSQPGTITSIRFYNTGGSQLYTASLWDVANTLIPLSTLSTTVDPNGWQVINIPDYHIIPGITYVASVFIPDGNYGSNGGLITGPIAVPGTPITLLGPSDNGVYAYTNILTDYPNLISAGTAMSVDISLTTDYPLPVTLINLKATPENKNVAISWQTASESNNKGFEIQRSNNNENWYSIGFVNGAGNSSSTLNYSFIDKEPSPGKYYYRLNQTDLDNRSKLSATVSATISGKGKISLFQNAPNPVRTTTLIRFDLPDRQQVKLTVMDMTGREVQTLVNKTAEQGSHVITFNASSLSKQLYIIRLQTETEIITKQMLVE